MQHNRLKPILLAVTFLATVLTLFAANSPAGQDDIPATGGLSLSQWSPSDVLSISQKVMAPPPADTVNQHTDNIKK